MGHARYGHRMIVGCLAVTLGLGIGVVVAQERAHASASQHQGWWETENVQTVLGLGSNQVSAITKIEEQNLEAVQENRKAQRKAYREMIKYLTAESPSEAAIAEGRLALEEAWAESARLSVDHWVGLRNELSSEQWQMLPKVAPRALQLGGLRTRAMGTIRVGEKSD